MLEGPVLNTKARLPRRPQSRAVRLQEHILCQSFSRGRSASHLSPLPQAKCLSVEHVDKSAPSPLRTASSAALAFICSAAITLTPILEPLLPVAPAQAAEAYSVAAYERAVAGRREGGDDGPNLDLFTDDAQLAMSRWGSRNGSGWGPG